MSLTAVAPALAAQDYIALEGRAFDFALAGFYTKTWTGLTFPQIEEIVDQGYAPESALMAVEDFRAFLIAAGFDLSENPEVLLVNKSDKGVNVYGPRIMASSDGTGLVLSTGNAIVPVTQDGEKVAVGAFSGKLTASTVEGVEGSVLVVGAKLKTKSGHMFRVAVATDKETCNSEGMFERTIDSGKPLADICKRKAAGGSFPSHMKELDLGSYLVTGAKFSPKSESQKFESWAVTLNDGRRFKAAGNCKRMLDQGYAPSPERPFILIVEDVEEKGGKVFVKNSFLPLALAEKNGLWPVNAKPSGSVNQAASYDPDGIPF